MDAGSRHSSPKPIIAAKVYESDESKKTPLFSLPQLTNVEDECPGSPVSFSGKDVCKSPYETPSAGKKN